MFYVEVESIFPSYQDFFLEKPGNELNNTFGRLLSVLM